MKSIYKFLISAILFANFTYGQVSTSIIDVLVNSQTTVTSCSTINFETNSNNTLNFFYRLQKSSSGFCSNGTLKIMLKYSPSTNGSQRGGSIILQSTSWDTNNRSEGYITCNISESEVQVSGSSIYLEYTDCDNNITKSCEYTIIKTPLPSFTLSPTSLSLPCGDTSAKTFTVTPANIPSGASVTYSWSNPGWTLVSSTSNSRTLQPSSGTSLPSNVSVTPYINGVAKPTQTCTINRSPFTTSQVNITGSNNICSGSSNYTISGTGANTVSWSISNTSIATISNLSSTGVTVNRVGSANGSISLNATIINSCNQQVIISKLIFIGNPVLTGLVSGPTCVKFGQKVTYVFNGSANFGGSAYQWSVDAPIDDNSSPNSPSNCSWKYLSTQGNNTFTFKAGCIPATVVVRVKIDTSCGSSNYSYLYVNVNATGTCNNRIANIKNENGSFSSYNENSETNELSLIDDNVIKVTTIFDLSGMKIKEFSKNDYDLSELKSGIYIVRIEKNDGEIETTKIMIE